MTNDAFISYSKNDKATADAICKALEAHHLRCWYAARDIPSGADWDASIMEALANSRVMILVWSSQSDKSRQVKREVAIALDDIGITLIPFRIEEIVPSKLRYYLGNIQWLDASTTPLEDNLQRLVEQVKTAIPQGSQPVGSPVGPIEEQLQDSASASRESEEERAREQAAEEGRVRVEEKGEAAASRQPPPPKQPPAPKQVKQRQPRPRRSAPAAQQRHVDQSIDPEFAVHHTGAKQVEPLPPDLDRPTTRSSEVRESTGEPGATSYWDVAAHLNQGGKGSEGAPTDTSSVSELPAASHPTPSPLAHPEWWSNRLLWIIGGSVMLLVASIIIAISYNSSTPETSSSMPETSSSRANANASPQIKRNFRNQVGIELVYVPAGSFMMGSENGETNEKPVHRVTIGEGFYIGEYEVTQAQWQQVMGNNPSQFKGGNLPVERVSWDDAQEFIRKLNAMDDGFIYRLPSEAEWEYACRAGTTGDYAGNLDSMAWYSSNSESQTHPVGQKQPNAFGLYDMHGNVWEWCADYSHDSYNDAPTDGSAWLSVVESGGRVFRGGSWSYSAVNLRSALRNWSSPDLSYFSLLGLRLVAVARS